METLKSDISVNSKHIYIYMYTHKCNRNDLLPEQGRKTSFDFYSVTTNCFDKKSLINNNIKRNKIFPTGAHCGRWYELIQLGFVNIHLTSTPRLKFRHHVGLTFQDTQSWDSPACLVQISGHWCRDILHFKAFCNFFFVCILSKSQETNKYHISHYYSLPTLPPSQAHIYSAPSSGYTSLVWANLISKCQ